jgi:hypothetical protein
VCVGKMRGLELGAKKRAVVGVVSMYEPPPHHQGHRQELVRRPRHAVGLLNHGQEEGMERVGEAGVGVLVWVSVV